MKNIDIPKEKIAQFCQQWQIVELSLFGSALRDDFHQNSDIDILVKFAENHQITLFDLTDMEDELTSIFHRKVDLISKKGIENSRNHLRKQNIINSSHIIYAKT